MPVLLLPITLEIYNTLGLQINVQIVIIFRVRVVLRRVLVQHSTARTIPPLSFFLCFSIPFLPFSVFPFFFVCFFALSFCVSFSYCVSPSLFVFASLLSLLADFVILSRCYTPPALLASLRSMRIPLAWGFLFLCLLFLSFVLLSLSIWTSLVSSCPFLVGALCCFLGFGFFCDLVYLTSYVHTCADLTV